MKRLDLEFAGHGQAAIDIVRAGELSRTYMPRGASGSPVWTDTRLEALYELSFLRMFVAWETYLEESFFRYMCGHASRLGQEAMKRGAYYALIVDAEQAVLDGRGWRFWYSPDDVLKICRKHINGGRHEAVIASHLATLRNYAAIRHRIVHGNEHARKQFDNASLRLAGTVYARSRPGKLLRDWDRGVGAKVTWLERIEVDLLALTGQIA